jgi:hypothetical protein
MVSPGSKNISSHHSSYYLLAILNSKLMSWYFKQSLEGRALSTVEDTLIRLPIVTAQARERLTIEQISLLETNAKKMIALHEELSKQEDPAVAAKTKQDISALDTEMNQAVYTLYGLTKKERAFIEKVSLRRQKKAIALQRKSQNR